VAPSTLDVARVQRALRRFAAERDWERFHTPRSLVLALAGELGELCEIFQWLSDAEAADIMRNPRRAAAVRDELADVAIYVLRIADVLGVDLPRAIDEKIQDNAKKYPVRLARGHATKYTELRPRKRTRGRSRKK
jgi:NTP pyrophosphatase (non-canonical NTP hydrolase)